MPDEATWLTPEAHAKLQAELSHLETAGRRAVEERIAEARSHGDIRENADYDAAKDDQGLMEARIRQLQHILRTAEVRAVADTGKVEIGSIVTIVDGDGDTVDVFVAPAENEPPPGAMRSSPESPLGGALLGAAPGQRIAYEAPAGTIEVEVQAVRPYGG
ncbi:MAG: GreA/GreB family elongation factor [Acidimicrobiia bacterium]